MAVVAVVVPACACGAWVYEGCQGSGTHTEPFQPPVPPLPAPNPAYPNPYEPAPPMMPYVVLPPTYEPPHENAVKARSSSPLRSPGRARKARMYSAYSLS